MDEVVELAEQRVNGTTEAKYPTSNPLELRKELGTALYRVGRFEEAKREFAASLDPGAGAQPMKLHDRILAASFLSMAETSLGDKASAELWLNKAKAWEAAVTTRTGWHQLRIELALEEATSMLGAE